MASSSPYVEMLTSPSGQPLTSAAWTSGWARAASAFASELAAASGLAAAPAPGPGQAGEPFIDSFCRPQFNGTWQSITNELGAFTPCFIDIVVLGTACLCLLLFASIRLSILLHNPPAQAPRLCPYSFVLQARPHVSGTATVTPSIRSFSDYWLALLFCPCSFLSLQ